MAVSTPVCNFGWKAVDFELTDTTGAVHTLDTLRGPNGLLLMFICNHCPYVKGVITRLCDEVVAIRKLGIGVGAVMSNDTDAYPEDSFANMQQWAIALNFPFPYLFDPKQTVAQDYGAACTPDFFGFNQALELQYRGRLDSSGKDAATPETRRELFFAMQQIAETGRGPGEQTPSIGCSIKWRNGH